MRAVRHSDAAAQFIFEFNAAKHIKFWSMLRVASILTLLWCFMVLAYAFMLTEPRGFAWVTAIPQFALPLILLGSFLVAFLFFSFHSDHW